MYKGRTMRLECGFNFPIFSHSSFINHNDSVHPSLLYTLASPFSLSRKSFTIYIVSSFKKKKKKKKKKKMGSERERESNGVQSEVKVVQRGSKVRAYHHVLVRFVVVALTLVATIIVGVDKETRSISIYAGMHFQATAHWHYMSAFVFFLASNAIACSYAAAALVILEVARRSNKGNNNNNIDNDNNSNVRYLKLGVTTSDLVITALLFSANGAAAAIGVIGQRGNSHVQWMKVCNVFDAYCRHMTTAIVLSLIASTLFLWLVVLSVFRLNHI